MDKTIDNKAQRKSRTVSSKEISVFCAQVGLLLNAGISLSDGLASMSGAESGDQNPLLTQIAEKVGETGSLYEAISATGVFPDYMVQMIHVGETVGKLEDVLESLSVYYNRDEKMREALRSAVLYPFILITLMTGVIAILVAFILPVFSDVFENLGLHAAGVGSELMNVGVTIGYVSLVCVIVILAVMVFIFAMSLHPAGKALLIKLCGGLPFMRNLFGKIASSRFALAMYMMLNSGFELDRALEMSLGLVSDRTVKEKIEQCIEKVKGGTSFAVALSEIGLFTGLYARMVQTGEKTGRLDNVMDQLSVRINEDVDKKLADLIDFIEPTLVILLSIIIGAILLSIMLPLVDVMLRMGLM